MKKQTAREPVFNLLFIRAVSAVVLPLLTATAMTQGFCMVFLRGSDGVYVSMTFWSLLWLLAFLHCFLGVRLFQIWLRQLSVSVVCISPFFLNLNVIGVS